MQPVTLLCIAVQLPRFHSHLYSSPPPAHSCICEVDSIGRIRSAGQRRPPDGDTLQPAGTLAQKTLGNKGSRGVFYEATQVFVPGTTGSEWPEPEFDDLERFNSAQLEASSKIEVRLLALFSLPSNACVPRAAPPAGSGSRPCGWNLRAWIDRAATNNPARGRIGGPPRGQMSTAAGVCATIRSGRTRTQVLSLSLSRVDGLFADWSYIVNRRNPSGPVDPSFRALSGPVDALSLRPDIMNSTNILFFSS